MASNQGGRLDDLKNLEELKRMKQEIPFLLSLQGAGQRGVQMVGIFLLFPLFSFIKGYLVISLEILLEAFFPSNHVLTCGLLYGSQSTPFIFF